MNKEITELTAKLKAGVGAKNSVKEITLEMFSDRLHYNGEFFVWKQRPLSEFPSKRAYSAWNSRFAGRRAGSISPQGYDEIQIDGSKYKAHRLVWCLHHGSIPKEMQIDHINHIRSDNRLENLRLVDQVENERNASLRKDNKCGKPGVKWHSSQKRWHAFIRTGGKQIHLGCFKEYGAAVEAREMAEREHGYHVNHGKPRSCAAAGIKLQIEGEE